METTVDFFMTLICGECGVSRRIKDKEIPVGDCRFCKKDFGYYILPEELYQKAFHSKAGQEPFKLQSEDMLTLNTRLKAVDSRRIAIIVRDGKEIYRDRNYVG